MDADELINYLSLTFNLCLSEYHTYSKEELSEEYNVIKHTIIKLLSTTSGKGRLTLFLKSLQEAEINFIDKLKEVFDSLLRMFSKVIPDSPLDIQRSIVKLPEIPILKDMTDYYLQ